LTIFKILEDIKSHIIKPYALRLMNIFLHTLRNKMASEGQKREYMAISSVKGTKANTW
jgi:hypothetical protein